MIFSKKYKRKYFVKKEKSLNHIRFFYLRAQACVRDKKRSHRLFKFNHGMLYPILHKLEKDGLISGLRKQQGPIKKRKYYIIPAKGRKLLNSQVSELRDIYKLFFNILGEIKK